MHGNTAICLEDDKKRHFERYTGIVDVTLSVLPFPHLLGIHSRSYLEKNQAEKKPLFPILLILVHSDLQELQGAVIMHAWHGF